MLTKKFFIDLHGCAKNQVDAEIIIGIMENLAWENSALPEEADLIIVNSCGFIEPAKEESINAVIDARNSYPDAKILLAGCLAERYADLLAEDLPEADGVFGNGDLLKLPEIVEKLFPPDFDDLKESEAPLQFFTQVKTKTKREMLLNKKVLRPPQIGISCGIRPRILNFPRSAYIKITEGCNHCCTFCAIPLIRGSLRSRPIKDIVEEIEEFIAKGFYEFNLIGQDLAAFQTGIRYKNNQDENGEASPSGLSQLLKAISELKGDFRIRLLYIHPDNFPPDILPVMISDTRFLPYFDIPFQSGCEKIIKSMNRRGSAKIYLQLINKIKKAFQEANSPYGEPAIRTTFLLGFPGETDKDFEETANFLKSVQTMWSGGFVYSREEDTPAYSFRNRVAKKVAEERLKKMQAIQTKISEKKLQRFVGEELEILIEELISEKKKDELHLETVEQNSDEEEFQLAFGRAWFQAPEVDGIIVVNFSKEKTDLSGQKITAGSVVRAKVIAGHGFDLEALVK